MVNLIGNFSRLSSQNILVAGDFVLDTYTVGAARRISPEAPVPVISVQSTEERPGMAGNTILNLVSMGAKVSALGRIGKDAAGESLYKALKRENIHLSGIFQETGFPTPIKNRIIAGNQQLVRIDHEINTPLPQQLEKEIIQNLPDLLKGIKVVAISDYGKGFLTHSLLKALIETARSLGIFVIVDPKGTDYKKYSGAHLIKPNLGEAYAAARLEPQACLDDVAHQILQSLNTDYLVITRSEDGISLFEKKGGRADFPVKAKSVKDVTGAGDTVLATLALAIANDLPLETALHFSNIAAGIAIEEFGCARITLSKLAKRLLETDVTNKIFDSDHLPALKAALANSPCKLVPLSGTVLPSPPVLQSLLDEKKSSGVAIMTTIEKPPFDPSIVNFLASFQPIDFILLNTPLEQIYKHFPRIQIWDRMA